MNARVYTDFHNADAAGRVRLNCAGTVQDLARQNISLREGRVLTLYSDDVNEDGEPDDLEVEGRVTYSGEEHTWVAVIDWAAIHHASARRKTKIG
jgi:hypothetical protein